MSNCKGQLVLVAIFFFAFIIVMFLVLTIALHGKYGLQIKKTFRISLQIEDSGSEIISLMNSNISGIKYMEVIGDLAANNHDFYIGYDKDSLKTTMLKMRNGAYDFYVIWPGGEESLKEGNVDCSAVIDEGIILDWPVPASHSISSPYKENRGDHLHGGIDIPGDNMDVIAAADGEVILAGWENPNDHSKGFGKRITLRHKLEGERYYYTIYGHLSEILVEATDKDGNPTVVRRGQVIGKTGNTGYSTGSHLHFELADGQYVGRNSINICPYLGNPYGCLDPNAPDVSIGIYGTEIPIPGAQPGMLKGEAEFLC